MGVSMEFKVEVQGRDVNLRNPQDIDVTESCETGWVLMEKRIGPS